jgi:hypothetical protein
MLTRFPFHPGLFLFLMRALVVLSDQAPNRIAENAGRLLAPPFCQKGRFSPLLAFERYVSVIASHGRYDNLRKFVGECVFCFWILFSLPLSLFTPGSRVNLRNPLGCRLYVPILFPFILFAFALPPVEGDILIGIVFNFNVFLLFFRFFLF